MEVAATENRRAGGLRDRVGRWLDGAWPVVLITLFGALLRFAFLDCPGIWADEAQTYGRVNGSYSQLLDVLQFDGFAPLHYELYFFLARHFTLGPWLMRLWPAIAGTATVPAMYFLARQLASRRTALLACLLTACSAYLLYYSRDAKMYAPLWLFVTLSMGCFCWWLNTGKRLGWWLWVLCTMAAMGIHTPGAVVILAELLALAVHRRRGFWRWVFFLVGLGIVSVGPAWHYSSFNKMSERIDEMGWNASMLQWIGPYNDGRGLPELTRFTAGEYAVGWEWTDKPLERAVTPPKVLTAFERFVIVGGCVLAAAFVPWRRLGRWALQLGRWVVGRRVVGPLPPLPAVFPSWGKVMVLAGWIILPAYGVYVKSIEVPAAPWGIYRWVLTAGPWAWGVTAVVGVGLALSIRNWRGIVKVLAVAGVLFGVCCGIYEGIWFDRTHRMREVTVWSYTTMELPPAPEPKVQRRNASAVGTARDHAKPLSPASTQPVPVKHDFKIKIWDFAHASRPTPAHMLWMPRYLGAAFPAVVIVVAGLLRRLPIGVREAAVVGLVACNLGNYGAKLWIDPEPPVGQIIDEAWRDQQLDDATATSLVFVPLAWGPGFEPGTGTVTGACGRYYVSIKLDPPMDPPMFRNWGRAVDYFLHLRTNIRVRDVQAELRRRPKTTTVIVWDRYVRGRSEPPDPMLATLGRDWRLKSVQEYHAFDHWKWEPLTETRRYEYERIAWTTPVIAPARPPAPRPTPQPTPIRPTVPKAPASRPSTTRTAR